MIVPPAQHHWLHMFHLTGKLIFIGIFINHHDIYLQTWTSASAGQASVPVSLTECFACFLVEAHQHTFFEVSLSNYQTDHNHNQNSQNSQFCPLWESLKPLYFHRLAWRVGADQYFSFPNLHPPSGPSGVPGISVSRDFQLEVGKRSPRIFGICL